MVGFTLVGCGSNLSGIEGASEAIENSGEDLANYASLASTAMGSSSMTGSYDKSKNIQVRINNVKYADMVFASFPSFDDALSASSGVSIEHWSRVTHSQDKVAVSKYGSYFNVSLHVKGKLTNLPQVILEGACKDYVFAKNQYQNFLNIDHKETGKTAGFVVTGNTGSVTTFLYFSDGYAYIQYHGTNGSAQLDNRWFNHTIDGSGRKKEIGSSEKSEIICMKYSELAQRNADKYQEKYFGLK